MSGDLSIFKNDENFIFLIGLLEKNMHLSNTNSAEFAPEFRGSRLKTFQMIVPALSFFNHSCHVMIIRMPHRDMTTMTAVLPIEKGEQIFDNYGTLYYELEKQERQSELKRKYRFTCTCIACQENFPILPTVRMGKMSSEYMKMAKLLEHVCDKLSQEFSNADYSLARIKNHPLIDVSKDIPQVAKMIEYFYKHFDINSEEVFTSVQCLQGCYRLSEKPFLSLL